MPLFADRVRYVIMIAKPTDLFDKVRHISGNRDEVDPLPQFVLNTIASGPEGDAIFNTGLPVSSF